MSNTCFALNEPRLAGAEIDIIFIGYTYVKNIGLSGTFTSKLKKTC